MSDLVLVVPVYNEAERLDAVPWLEFLAANKSSALVFVDDGSTDRTAEVVERIRGEAPDQILILRLAENGGKAEAVRTGMVQALATTEMFAGFIDADLAAPLSEVRLLRTDLEAHPDVWAAFGSRVKLLGREIDRSERRHYLGRVFATLASFAVSLPVYDTQCGLKLFRHVAEVCDAFASPFRSRWIFDVELLARLNSAAGPDVSARIREVPLEHWHERGTSRLRMADWLRAPLELVQIRWRRSH